MIIGLRMAPRVYGVNIALSLAISVLYVTFAIQTIAAESPGACISEYLSQQSKGPSPLGIEPSDAEELISKVANSIGLSTNNIIVFPCRFALKAYAWVAPNNTLGVPEGSEYIIYNSDWVREVIGKDQVQAIALFGHELGHLLDRHFTAGRNLSPKEKETQADHFAGCAVARLGGSWAALKDLLSRLRREQDELYPDRLASLTAAKKGFKTCSRGGETEQQANLPTKPRTPPHMDVDTFTPIAEGTAVDRTFNGNFTEMYNDPHAKLHIRKTNVNYSGWDGPGDFRAAMSFDLSKIPPTALIDKAILSVSMSELGDETNLGITLFGFVNYRKLEPATEVFIGGAKILGPIPFIGSRALSDQLDSLDVTQYVRNALASNYSVVGFSFRQLGNNYARDVPFGTGLTIRSSQYPAQSNGILGRPHLTVRYEAEPTPVVRSANIPEESQLLQSSPGRKNGQIPKVFKDIVEGTPNGDCASEARGSSVQMFENGWLLANFAENLHYAIWRQEDGRVNWLKVSESSLVTERSCSGVKGAQLLQLGFRAQYCGTNAEALRMALGSPIEEETRAWVQYQRFSGGLLVYGLPGKRLQPENPVFQVLIAAFLERENDDDMGQVRIRAITADSSERDAYCTALWYPAAKDLAMSPIQQAHLSKCLTTIRPEHYSENRKSCSVYGY